MNGADGFHDQEKNISAAVASAVLPKKFQWCEGWLSLRVPLRQHRQNEFPIRYSL